MPRIVGVDVPNNKPAWIALTYIHGVGVHRSKKILAEIGVDVSLRASKLSEDEVSRIAQIIKRHCLLSGHTASPWFAGSWPADSE
jgi:small subunit ribosomal protein S13